MDMNNVNIEEIVKQVLSGMTGNAPAAAAAPAAAMVPQTMRPLLRPVTSALQQSYWVQ